jgi:hypothetical protein
VGEYALRHATETEMRMHMKGYSDGDEVERIDV